MCSWLYDSISLLPKRTNASFVLTQVADASCKHRIAAPPRTIVFVIMLPNSMRKGRSRGGHHTRTPATAAGCRASSKSHWPRTAMVSLFASLTPGYIHTESVSACRWTAREPREWLECSPRDLVSTTPYFLRSDLRFVLCLYK